MILNWVDPRDYGAIHLISGKGWDAAVFPLFFPALHFVQDVERQEPVEYIDDPMPIESGWCVHWRF